MSYKDWIKCKISDLGDVVSGGTPSTKIVDNWDGEISWITPKDLSGFNNRFISTGERKISDKGLANSSAKLMPKGSVLFSSRAPIGYVAIASKELSTNQGFKSIVPNGNNYNIFIYYLLKYITEDIKSIAGGSTFSEISGTAFKNIEIKIPKLNEQKAIANILSSLDDKIELNNKINRNLEELAQTLYKHWFVDFEFPNEEGLPYKSSGGKMIESEQGLIPEGWEVKNLNSLVKQYRIKSNPNENEKLIDLANMPGYSLTLDSYDYGDKLKTNIYEMKKNNILYGSIRPYLGKFGIAPFDGLTTGTIHQFLPINNSEYSAVSTLVFSKEFNDFCIKLSYGTKMPVINWKQLGTYKVIYNNDLFEKFNEITKSYYENIVKNINENIKLRNIRDLLLPKLMSGEI
ncbi:MAG: restriction endonuclease subunit S, partial [Acholeplasmataceae bacterium]